MIVRSDVMLIITILSCTIIVAIGFNITENDIINEDSSDDVISVAANKSNINANSVNANGETRIALYAVIFVLSVLGNLLVILTLVQNKRMRTVTNVLLLNLAISDLLLSVFCMPFTLVGAVKREFIFGPVLCKLIPYMQGLSVSVGVWTLVAISLERYFAICQPLRSRRWQTLSHVYKMIGAVWLLSIVWMLPIALVSQLLPLKYEGKFKCREVWPSPTTTKIFTIFLDFILLIVPLTIMVLAYCLISKTLYRGMQQEVTTTTDRSTTTMTTTAAIKSNKQTNAIGLTIMKEPSRHNTPPELDEDDVIDSMSSPLQRQRPLQGRRFIVNGSEICKRWTSTSKSMQPEVQVNTDTEIEMEVIKPQQQQQQQQQQPFRRIIRRTNLDKSLAAKRRVIRMLFVVVLEFFVCWTPLYVLNTMSLFAPEVVYSGLGPRTISLVQLLAYVSSCCNPITYCFMHKKFRQSFLTVFGCRRRRRRRRQRNLTSGGTANGGNDGSFYLSRQSTMRTEIVCSDKNDDSLARQMRLLTATTDQSIL